MSKSVEFKKFLEIIKEEGQFAHWSEIGRALNISKNTLTAWKELPEAKVAIAEGISRSLKNMEDAGKKDWRMWESKLKLLGMNPVNEVKHDFADPITEILKKYGLNNDAGKAEESSGDPSTSST